MSRVHTTDLHVVGGLNPVPLYCEWTPPVHPPFCLLVWLTSVRFGFCGQTEFTQIQIKTNISIFLKYNFTMETFFTVKF